MSVALAPTWRAAAARALMLCAAIAVVAAFLYLLNGAPSPERRVTQNERARFAPTAWHGLTQFLGEAALVALAAVVARRGLKIRL